MSDSVPTACPRSRTSTRIADQLIDLPRLEFLASDEEEGVASPIWNGSALTRPVRIVNEPRTRSPLYDTELVSGRPPAPHFHSWTHWFWQAKEMWPEQFVMMHPDKAIEIGAARPRPRGHREPARLDYRRRVGASRHPQIIRVRSHRLGRASETGPGADGQLADRSPATAIRSPIRRT